jgi:nucleoside-diphosphate-sugar epimerase
MHETAGDPIVEFRRVNVFGTRIVRDAAVAAGVKCFIFVSSVKAVGEQSIQPWTSKTLPQPLDAYGMSKLEAEQLFTNTAFTTINPTIVRLPLVYGPGVQGNVLRLFNAVQRGVPIPVGLARNARSMVYVGNVTAAIRLALESPDGKPTRIAPTPFFLSDGPAISTESLVRMIARALGRKAHLTRIPIPVLRGVANIADRLLVVLSDVPRLTPAIDRLVGSLEVDGTEFERVFSFTPPFSLEQGLESTARWFMSTSTAG